MRNLRVGLKAVLLVVGLLAVVATPAMAQLGDPLSLVASGVLIPFFGSGSQISLLEIAVPVQPGPDKIVPGGNPTANMHVILYDNTCVRGQSFPAPDTVNGVTLYGITGGDGLAAIADSGNGIDLSVLLNPIHTRVYWINVASTQFRVLEPIGLDMGDVPDGANFGLKWNPIRSGATFFAPQENAAGLQTTLYLICPKSTIQGAAGSAFPVANGFPSVLEASGATGGFLGSYAPAGTGPLRGRVYRSNPGHDDHELFIRDWQIGCDCLQTRVLSGTGAISNVYVTADTYTEMETDNTFAGFTGYKGLKFVPNPAVDFFGRLSNGNRLSLRGTLPAPALSR